MTSPLLAAATFTAALFLASHTLAAPPITFEADRLEADPDGKKLHLQGKVRLGFEGWRLNADELQITYAPKQIYLQGTAELAPCPCPDPPLTLTVSAARLEPPGDLFLTFPRIRLFGLPIFALPWLWIRTPDHPGLLPPFVTLRGQNGLLVGAGVHFPGLDLTAAAYLKGGFELGAELLTPTISTHIVYDYIQTERIVLESRGTLTPQRSKRASLSWTLDAIRGERALSGTVPLAPAAHPYDHAQAETALRADTPSHSALFATGLNARALRGQGPLLAGPSATLAAHGAFSEELGTYRAHAAGLLLADQTRAVPIGQSAIDLEFTRRPGPFELRLDTGARAYLAAPTQAPSAHTDLALGARVRLEMPLIRQFTSSAPTKPPLTHTISPGLELRAALTQQQGTFFQAISPPLLPALASALATLDTSLGHDGGPALHLALAAGALTTPDGPAPLFHTRLRSDFTWASANIELAAATGFALLARTRLGDPRYLALHLELAGALGPDPRLARSLTTFHDAVPGPAPAFFASAGWTGATALDLPLGKLVRAGLRTDLDLIQGELVALRGALAYAHPCGCLSLSLLGAQRVGRPGVDLLFFADLLPSARAMSWMR